MIKVSGEFIKKGRELGIIREAATVESAQRAIKALRKPDASLASVCNTVRQSIADVIEDSGSEAERLRNALAAEAIRSAWSSAIVEVEKFPDDPASLIEQHGKLRQALLEIAGELHAVLVQQSPNDDKIIMDHVREASEIAKRALKSGLLGE